MKEKSIELLNKAVADDEERHYNQYDKETDNLTKFGDNYLALQSIERSKTLGSGKPVGE